MKIQADKSTEVDNKATMLVCVQYIFGRMCMRMYYVQFCCQPMQQLQNYSSLWMITYQEKWIDHFMSVYGWTEWLSWLSGFLVLLLGSKRSLLNVSLRTVSSMEKCWLAEKCRLNLWLFVQDVIKIINHIKVHALNSHLFLLLCEEMDTEHTCLLFYREVRCLSKTRHLAREATREAPEIPFRKSHHWQHISVTQNGSQKYSTCSTLSLHGKWQLCSSQQIKWLPSKPNWNYGGDKWTLGFLTCLKH